MNTARVYTQPPPWPPQRPDPAVWHDPTMRVALANRDITTVYRLLNRAGFSQQHIGALTGQSQPEVCLVMRGKRAIAAYELLSRIADGLGGPRGPLPLTSRTSVG
ncbi:MAG: hypothetical protein HY241_01565 [Actinobacteria bacterium]|nr:hypothetical protein [Actinomycetota bacterium]